MRDIVERGLVLGVRVEGVRELSPADLPLMARVILPLSAAQGAGHAVDVDTTFFVEFVVSDPAVTE